MGIEGKLKRTAVEVLGTLRGDPMATQIFALLERHELTIRPDSSDPVPGALRHQMAELTKRSAGLWLLERLEQESPQNHAAIAPHLSSFQAEWQRPALDLYKRWHALHFLLCGHESRTEHVLSRVVFGSRRLAPPLDDPEVWYLDADEVACAARELRQVDCHRLTEDRDPMRVPDVYRWTWSVDHLEPYVHAVQEYYEAAASSGDGMLMWRA